MTQSAWPDVLWLVRHGESEGNAAEARAVRAGAARVDIDAGDMDMTLTAAGLEQARSLGRWFGGLEPGEQPDAALVSPYRRAQDTLRAVLDAANLTGIPVTTDERLRDREPGILDRLTTRGFREQHADEAARAERLGMFWYRPPGGESWADVALRVRAALTDLPRTRPGRRVLLVSHDMTVILIRYVLERLPVDDAVALSGQIRNCSVTTYRRDGAGLVLRDFNRDCSASAAGTGLPGDASTSVAVEVT